MLQNLVLTEQFVSEHGVRPAEAKHGPWLYWNGRKVEYRLLWTKTQVTHVAGYPTVLRSEVEGLMLSRLEKSIQKGLRPGPDHLSVVTFAVSSAHTNSTFEKASTPLP